ncbi:hypothetical protein [Poseidonibacter ostreae]|uniref:Uncharacterized protein n=1 Tax=Poseidonibacter ostreae TaxID=2654171 RepID=A0A6L4WWF8_9BACT|nr:hypothetical protein [Poseidonibacter ostreae]KAB7891268.1 hypothetical protein GBG19_00095 [Poseidonibacter ostreae]
MNLFILESGVGEHHQVNQKFNADVLSFTFIPLINSTFLEKDFLTDFSNLLPKNLNTARLNSIIIKILSVASYIKEKKYNKIFIGTDLDIMGNAMARIILDYLVSNGIDRNNIIRVPLTSQGFAFVSSFWDNETMNWCVDNMKEEMEYVQFSKKDLGSFGVGRRTALVVNELFQCPKSVPNINNQGTSSITYILKKKLKES